MTTAYFQQYFYPLTIIFAYLTILVVISEILNRFIQNDPELTRKIVHIGSGNVILLAWWLHISTEIIVAAAIIASIIALISYFVPILPSINSVGRKSLGTLFYAISIGILAQVFWRDYPQYTAIGILVMAWGDGMAAIIGQRFGNHSYQVFSIKKSWEGSLAMVLTTFTVTILILSLAQETSGHIWLIAAIVAIISTALEAFSKLGVDNLTVPLGSAALCYFCSQFFLSI